MLVDTLKVNEDTLKTNFTLLRMVVFGKLSLLFALFYYVISPKSLPFFYKVFLCVYTLSIIRWYHCTTRHQKLLGKRIKTWQYITPKIKGEENE